MPLSANGLLLHNDLRLNANGNGVGEASERSRTK